ncbi:DUF4381 domain-containing protein [uncultured Paraglaciecola sp.]|uniref:DUF4381 domain-containing protein n=1 Tax=uncultured Paraglaciecola sp. TaxID=1765024 RepID=UPI002624CA85|nr:DUF4381 domain-containing protein [uncultured Paraglaciecola sp.]
MNPLQNLQDIHTPAAIENWPPAYGWWLVAIITIIAVCILTTWLVKRRKLRLAKRQGLAALQKIDASRPDSLSQLNQLLKRVAMAYFPAQRVQQIHGQQWANFLIDTLPKNKNDGLLQSFESMQQALYQPQKLESVDYPSYRQSAELWIKHALPPSKKTLARLEQDYA